MTTTAKGIPISKATIAEAAIATTGHRSTAPRHGPTTRPSWPPGAAR
jgi:hypothetical protein